MIKIPNKIKDYKLLKVITTEKNDDRVVCIYRNSNGKKAVAKIWFGKIKNESYKFLRNEYFAYQVISSILNSKMIPSNLKSIKVPKVINYIDKESISILLIEYIIGKKGSSLKDNQIIKNFYILRKFITFISKYMSDFDRKKFSNRKWLRYFIFYIFTLIVSIIKYPKYTYTLLTGLRLVIMNIGLLISDKSIEFVHGDLNFDNYIIDKKGFIYLIDFEFSKFTYAELEFASILRYCKVRNKLYQEFREEIYLTNHITEDQKILINVFSIMYATHGLTSRNSSKAELTLNYNFLKDSI